VGGADLVEVRLGTRQPENHNDRPAERAELFNKLLDGIDDS
jgi:hypothetical protein